MNPSMVGSLGFQFAQDGGNMPFLVKDIDPEPCFVIQGIGEVAGTLGNKIPEQPLVCADQVEGEHLGLKGGQLPDGRFDIDRHQNAVAFHLQGLPTVIFRSDTRSCLLSMAVIQ
jgi:hypothetical protein